MISAVLAAAVAQSEIIVLIAEAAAAVVCFVVALLLRRAVKRAAKAQTKADAASGVPSSDRRDAAADVPVGNEKIGPEEKQYGASEKDDVSKARQDNEALKGEDGDGEKISENALSEEECPAAGADGGDDGGNEPNQAEEPYDSAEEQRKKAEFDGNVSELQQYLQQVKHSAGGNGPAYSVNTAADTDSDASREGYVGMSSGDGTADSAFVNYSDTDKDYLRRHIAESRQKARPAKMPEHEKVDWDKVKQYNSAILSVGEIDDSDDKKH